MLIRDKQLQYEGHTVRRWGIRRETEDKLTSTLAVEYSPHIPRRTCFSLCTLFHVGPPCISPRDRMDAHRVGSPLETTASRSRILLSIAKNVRGRRAIAST